MQNKPLTYILILLAAFFTLWSCKKDEFINLTSTISGESKKLGTDEGGSVIANILLTDELSEDLTLQLRVETTNIPNFINEDDYDPIFEYSNDLGKTWVTSNNQEVVFKNRNRNLKIRLQTYDDDKIEYHEEFDLILTPKIKAGLNILGSIEPIRIAIDDNDENVFAPGLLGALYEVDENYNFKLIALNRNELFDENHKRMIDNGLDPKLIADISKVTQTGDLPIVNFEAIYQNSGLGGFVFNQSTDGGNEWYMGLNLLFAYNDFDEMGLKKMEYNENGNFGYILTHEYGHILTLNKVTEIDTSIDPTGESCSELSLREGCFHSNSVLNQFSEAFYENNAIINYNEPHFVTEYAKSHIAEDIAESFAFQVTQNVIPHANDDSSGALHKIHFVRNNPSLSEYRGKIRNVLSNVDEAGVGANQMPIWQFNFTKEGERISCTNHQAIIDAAKKRQFAKY